MPADGGSHYLQGNPFYSSLMKCYIFFFQIQRYEAASTIYGPHTLDIFLNKFHEYAEIAIKVCKMI